MLSRALSSHIYQVASTAQSSGVQHVIQIQNYAINHNQQTFLMAGSHLSTTIVFRGIASARSNARTRSRMFDNIGLPNAVGTGALRPNNKLRIGLS